jgi:hypothetical protein
MSLRDIPRIVGEEVDRRQSGKFLVKSSQALALFLKNKSPINVAIEVNMREKEVTELYESLVKYFRNNDPTYQNIKKSLEDKATKIFSNSKSLLQKVATTLFHSMITDPNKCAELIYCLGGK